MIKFEGRSNDNEVKKFLTDNGIKWGQCGNARLFLVWEGKEKTIFKGDWVFIKDGKPHVQIIIK